MMDKINLKVVSPNGELLNTVANSVQLPAHDGSRGVLPGHEAMIVALKSGTLFYTFGDKREALEITGGVASITKNAVSVITE